MITTTLVAAESMLLTPTKISRLVSSSMQPMKRTTLAALHQGCITPIPSGIALVALLIVEIHRQLSPYGRDPLEDSVYLILLGSAYAFKHPIMRR